MCHFTVEMAPYGDNWWVRDETIKHAYIMFENSTHKTLWMKMWVEGNLSITPYTKSFDSSS